MILDRKLQSLTSRVAKRRKGTGPRTELGKERSKHNARTHGIFSNVVVLESESRAEFDALLNGLRKDFQPVETLERTLSQLERAQRMRLGQFVVPRIDVNVSSS
jgi:hypothetical protein